ncbi:MAG: hypothetical protein V3T24_12400 [Longimicrobiales bacterium]
MERSRIRLGNLAATLSLTTLCGACQGKGLTGPTSGSAGPTSGPAAPAGQPQASSFSIEVVTVTYGLPPDPDGYTVTLDDRIQRRLGRNESLIFDGLSGDSHRLALSGVADNCVVDGGDTRAVTIGGSRGWVEFEVACSGAARLDRQIVFTSLSAPYGEEIWAMSANGQGATRLTRPHRRSDFARVSADGSRVAFASPGDDPRGRWALFVMNADGSGEERLTPFSDNVPGSWSPDGGWIAFTSGPGSDGRSLDAGMRGPSDGGNIHIIRADGSEEIRLTDDSARDHDPAWSPDGKSIVFATDREGNLEIYRMRLSDRRLQNLTAHASFDAQPAWSPDGSKIAFTSRRDGNDDIYVMNADGSGVRRITAGPESDVDPAWSADGARVLFSSDREGAYQIFVVNADGSGRVRLTEVEGEGMRGQWSP